MKVVFKRTKLVFDGSEDKVVFHKNWVFSDSSVWNFASSGYSASDIYEVEQGAKIKIKNFSVGAAAYMISCLDSSKQIITSESYGKNETQGRDIWYEKTINNTNVKYIVLSTRNEDFSTPNTGYEAIITGYTDIINPQTL